VPKGPSQGLLQPSPAPPMVSSNRLQFKFPDTNTLAPSAKAGIAKQFQSILSAVVFFRGEGRCWPAGDVCNQKAAQGGPF